MSAHRRHTAEEEKRIREASLDETIEASFPASDSPSSVPNPDDDDALPPDEPRPAQEQDHEGATESQVGDRTGSGVGHDIDSPAGDADSRDS